MFIIFHTFVSILNIQKIWNMLLFKTIFIQISLFLSKLQIEQHEQKYLVQVCHFNHIFMQKDIKINAENATKYSSLSMYNLQTTRSV